MNTETTWVAGMSTGRLVWGTLFLGLINVFMVLCSA